MSAYRSRQGTTHHRPRVSDLVRNGTREAPNDSQFLLAKQSLLGPLQYQQIPSQFGLIGAKVVDQYPAQDAHKGVEKENGPRLEILARHDGAMRLRVVDNPEEVKHSGNQDDTNRERQSKAKRRLYNGHDQKYKVLGIGTVGKDCGHKCQRQV